MLPEHIKKLIYKYQNDNISEIRTINNSTQTILDELNSIKQNLSDQLHRLTSEIEVNSVEQELYNDLAVLHRYIGSVSFLEYPEMQPNVTAQESIMTKLPTFTESIILYLVNDNLCPVCNVKFEPKKIRYQNKNGNKIEDINLDGYKCPGCSRNFAIDFDVEDINFKTTNFLVNKKYLEEIPAIDIYSVIVLSNTTYCSVMGHKTKDVTLVLPTIDANGNLHKHEVTGSYCFDCKRFAMLKSDFSAIKESILCKIVDETIDYTPIKGDDFEISQRNSILYNYGYNVNSQKKLSDKQRRIILGSVVDAGIMNRRDIANHITSLIERGSKIPSWKTATEKWEKDRAFITCYQSSYLPQVIVDEVILKYHK